MIGLLVGVALAVPREQVIENATAFGTHTWTMTSANTRASCDSGYTSDYTAGTYVGLPYDWGGYMSAEEFDAEIAAGYGAGSHSSDGSLSCTAGLDCSGFVSMAWETGHYSTSTIPDVASPIEWDELQRGDVIDDPGSHVVLFTHVSEDGWPVFWEASGSASKVRLNSTGGYGAVGDYLPYRFDEIEDGSSTGTVSSPKAITSFPYTDYGWTAGAASDRFDVYSCSDADESGPEVIYEATLPGPGTLTAVVSDAEGVDIDVQVLSEPDADACLGRDDAEVSVHVDGATAWLVLDSYVGSYEYSGPYLLTVDFTPDAVDDPGEDTSPPSPDTGGDVGVGPSAPMPGQLTLVDGAGRCGCAVGGGVGGGGAMLAGLALVAKRRRGAT